ncbi:MAG TPA: MarR family transcriptional regulator [Rhizobiaceae bacterium]|nr:MarR family transcriptional regulator [Rhizobiaceae bacterium]
MDQRTPKKTRKSPAAERYDVADQPLLRRAGGSTVIDLDNYFPAYLAWTANKWARSASHLYLKRYGIGIEAWRLLVLLAVEGRITANRVCQVIGMDKASVSRNFKHMHESGLIEITDDPDDKRKRFAELTAAGFALHDRMLPVVMRREQRLLACLTKEERATLQSYLRRVHANLPALDDPSDYDD